METKPECFECYSDVYRVSENRLSAKPVTTSVSQWNLCDYSHRLCTWSEHYQREIVIYVKTATAVGKRITLLQQYINKSHPTELRQIREIPPQELNVLLANFHVTGNDDEHELIPLSAFFASFHRHLAQKGYPVNIMKAQQFETMRRVLKAKQKWAHEDGIGSGLQHLQESHEPLSLKIAGPDVGRQARRTGHRSITSINSYSCLSEEQYRVLQNI
ncbi:hypothetical protein BaRGS_00012352 [Batillaria attramentaria]|uniref:Uncharacterized protein n=1 Tax=Batillaria attramentaria TaxID=370345 RepID=A0ABD0LAM8_9CAEN